MSSSHPPTLMTLVRRTLLEECGLASAFRLAVAVSGGRDSMALCHALSLLTRKIDFELLVITVDHGLRASAEEEVRMVQRFCADHAIACVAVRLGLKAGSNLQERARTARYDRLWAVARERLGPEAFLATAHHAEDRAETVLLRLLRGTSLAGLSVLPPRSDRLLRPMIRASRADVDAHVVRHGIPYCDDPSNQDPRFSRVRVRNELMPILQDLGLGIVGHLVGLADEAATLPEPLGLNREQRSQLRRALKNPTIAVDLPLGGGLRLFRGPATKGANSRVRSKSTSID